MGSSGRNQPESWGPRGGRVPGWGRPGPRDALEELLGRAGAAAEPPVELGRRAASGPAPPVLEPLDGPFPEEPSPEPARRRHGGRHQASRTAHFRSAWTLAPGVLALISLVLFAVALTGNLGPAPAGGGQPGHASRGNRPAQAPPPEETPAEGTPARPPAAAELVVLTEVDGERLGDAATYADGVTGTVTPGGHADAGDGLAVVSVQVRLVNRGQQPVDARGARVDLVFARQSSRAAQVRVGKLGVVPPGGEASSEWAFRMPANQLGEVWVTLAPSARHQPVTFHGPAG